MKLPLSGSRNPSTPTSRGTNLRQQDFAPTPNPFGVLAELSQSLSQAQNDSDVPTPVRSQRRRGKRSGRRSGKRRRHRGSSPIISQVDDQAELCEKVAALCLDDEPRRVSRNSFQTPRLISTDSHPTAVEGVRHPWAPQFLPCALPVDTASSIPKTVKLPLQRDSRPPKQISSYRPFSTTADDLSKRRASSPVFPFSAFLSTLTPDSKGDLSSSSTVEPSKNPKLSDASQQAPYQSQEQITTAPIPFPGHSRRKPLPTFGFKYKRVKSRSSGVPQSVQRPFSPIEYRSPPLSSVVSPQAFTGATTPTPTITAAPRLPRFPFEPLSPTESTSASALFSLSSPIDFAITKSQTHLPMHLGLPSIRLAARNWETNSTSTPIFKTSQLPCVETPLSSSHPSLHHSESEPGTPERLSSVLFPPYLPEKDSAPTEYDSKSNGGPMCFFDMGHSSQCWCSKHAAPEPYPSNKDTGDTSLETNLAASQPRQQELEMETIPLHSPEPDNTIVETEAGNDIDEESELHSQISDCESGDWCSLNETMHPMVPFEEDWAFISPSTPYDVLSSASSSCSESRISTRTSTVPPTNNNALVPISLPPSPPLTPVFPPGLTEHSVLSDVDNEDNPESWAENEPWFSQDQDCGTCLQGDCNCGDPGPSAVEWPSPQESNGMKQRGRAGRT